MNLNIELIVAVTSASVALLALGFSVWQGYRNAKHQELSVLPHLTLDFDSRETHEISVAIRSNGTGPAIIRRYEWIVGNQSYEPKSSSDFYSILQALGLGDLEAQFYVPDLGGFLEPGFNEKLVKVVGSSGAADHESIRNKLFGASISIEYASVYGSSFKRQYSGKLA